MTTFQSIKRCDVKEKLGSACLLAAVSVAAQDVFLAAVPGPSKNDLVRARSTLQTAKLGGSSPQGIANKINSHVQNTNTIKGCDEHSIEELNTLVRDLFPHLNNELHALYAADDGRSRRLETLAEYEQLWASEPVSDATHESKCAEVLMLWAHHLTESSKKLFQKPLPTLPVFDQEKAANSSLYAEKTSCSTGHAMKKGGGTSTHQWPDWPEELHYTAKAVGAYPFWWGGGSDSGTADLSVWWSEKFGAEKFYHSSCTGQSSWLRGSCTHLMFASGTSYLYTDSKCCKSTAQRETLAPPQGNFVDLFTYNGEVNFNGVHYSGKAKYYTMKLPSSEPVTDFWYFTDLDGKPVQQGEAGTGPTDQGYPTGRGHTIWHDYDPASFDTSAIDDSVFDIPSYCQSTSTTCATP